MATILSSLILVSPVDTVDSSYISALPSPEEPTLFCVMGGSIAYAHGRVLAAEVLEQQGKYREAIQWATCDIAVRTHMCMVHSLAALITPALCHFC